MITAVDTSVIFALLKGEPSAHQIDDRLDSLATIGGLVVCEVVFAELSTVAPDLADLRKRLSDLRITLLRSTEEALFLAGQIFRRYRALGGARRRVLADFFVAAHAQLQTSQLVTSDRGFYRTYFPRLKIIDPLLR